MNLERFGSSGAESRESDTEKVRENPNGKQDVRETAKPSRNMETFNPDKPKPFESLVNRATELKENRAQDKEIKAVESGKKEIDSDKYTKETGNYGEMKMDQEFRKLDYKRISPGKVTDIDDSGHQGIDGVYYNEKGHPPIIIGEAKYNTSRLIDTADGKQMTPGWIDQRLDAAVGKEKADQIRAESLQNPDNVGKYVVRTYPDGNVKFEKLDDNANKVSEGDRP